MYSAIERSILIVPRSLSGFGSLKATDRYLFTVMGTIHHGAEERFRPGFF